MKKLIFAALVGSLALAVRVNAADDKHPAKKARKGKGAETAQAASGSTKARPQANVNRTSAATPAQQKSLNTARNKAAVVQNKAPGNNVAVSRPSNVNETAVQQVTTKKSARRSTVDRSRNLTVNRDRNVTVNRHRNVAVTNNWSGSHFSGQQYTAFRNYHRQRHDRNWWRSHYSRIVFFGGGSYYWNSGYWYPAWGYNPGYSYAYDGPIYGYNNLPPDQVVVNVQTQLQRNGYYSGSVDGSLGPITRQAIAAFQADRGLAITSAIDRPTLANLGLA